MKELNRKELWLHQDPPKTKDVKKTTTTTTTHTQNKKDNTKIIKKQHKPTRT